MAKNKKQTRAIKPSSSTSEDDKNKDHEGSELSGSTHTDNQQISEDLDSGVEFMWLGDDDDEPVPVSDEALDNKNESNNQPRSILFDTPTMLKHRGFQRSLLR